MQKTLLIGYLGKDPEMKNTRVALRCGRCVWSAYHGRWF
jgi:hypothetical protein